LKTNNQKIFYHYYFPEKRSCTYTFKNHVLIYIYSGELSIKENNKSLVLKKGECAFVAKHNLVFMTEQPEKDINFHSLFMTLPRDFICEFYHTFTNKDESAPCDRITLSILPQRPEITSLFESFKPYHRNAVDLSDELTRIKIAEGLYALLQIGEHYHYTLFDFVHNLDIIEILSASQNIELEWKIRQNFIHFNN